MTKKRGFLLPGVTFFSVVIEMMVVLEKEESLSDRNPRY